MVGTTRYLNKLTIQTLSQRASRCKCIWRVGDNGGKRGVVKSKGAVLLLEGRAIVRDDPVLIRRKDVYI